MNENLMNTEVHTALQVRNGQCQKQGDKLQLRYLKPTDSDDWREEKLSLKPGLNILYWSVFSVPSTSRKSNRPRDKFFAIRAVKITGK
jgi:hypothetical protein